jgi:hypothetical protein
MDDQLQVHLVNTPHDSTEEDQPLIPRELVSADNEFGKAGGSKFKHDKVDG